MKNRIIITVTAMLGLLATSCNKEIEQSQSQPQGEVIQTPITITAKYNGSTKVQYTENDNAISASWEEGDTIYVCYDGMVSKLGIDDGAGTTSATFTGTISHTHELTSTSMLVCYVKDKNTPNGTVTVSGTGTYAYSADAFLHQDGTLASAAKCNLYYGTTFYGTGSDISCTFNVNTSMLKLELFLPAGDAGSEATISYMSDETELAKVSITVGAYGMNSIYMTVPAGRYSGQQNIVYTVGSTNDSRTLSSSQANFTAGQTYSKDIFFVSTNNLSTLSSNDIIATGGVLTGTAIEAPRDESGHNVTIADGATIILYNATITASNSWYTRKAGIQCEGDATIILKGTNSIGGLYEYYPGIQAGPAGTTLTIQGDGSLYAISGSTLGTDLYGNASYSSGIAPGIGSSVGGTCGNIVIKGGTIVAKGMGNSAGIGSGQGERGNPGGICGNITIEGGTIDATGGIDIERLDEELEDDCTGSGVGIGCGKNGTCGTITIRNTVTRVTARGGTGAEHSIGLGKGTSCGTVTVEGVTLFYLNYITENPFTYQPNS